MGTGSGDTFFDWVFVFIALVVATMATTAWSALDRRRMQYDALHAWYRHFIRFMLTGQFLSYGMSKVIPIQMPFYRPVEASPTVRDVFADGRPVVIDRSRTCIRNLRGLRRITRGVLLIVPRTTMPGALIGLADMTQVFVLNIAYDVPVKLLSLHLLLLCLFLLAPDCGRLVGFFFCDRVTECRRNRFALFATARAARLALAAQVALGLYLISANIAAASAQWPVYGGARPKSLLYGIWNVAQLEFRPSRRTTIFAGADRPRRVIFDSPASVSFQRLDDTFESFGTTIDVKHRTIDLTRDDGSSWKQRFTFARRTPNRLELSGTIDGRKIVLELQLVDLGGFLLTQHDFHWIQESPFNR